MPTAPLYLSEPLLKIDGADAPPDVMRDILKIVVEESLHLPAMFTLVLHNNYIPVSKDVNRPWRHQKYIEIGKKIKVGFGNSVTKDPDFDKRKENFLIEGEITAIDVNFSNRSESHLIIRGYDNSHRLHRGRYNRSFQNMKDNDIVTKIVKEVGLETGEVENTGAPRDYVFQENQTNMEFLRELAARNGFELFVQDGKLNFRQPKQNKDLTLSWLQDINSFNVRVSSAQQVNSVEVRSWDYKNKKMMVETANSEKVVTNTENKKGSQTANKFNTSPKMIVVDHPVFSAKEAKRMAQALCDELGGEFIYADAKTDGNGNPEIRPGRVVTLQEMGNYSGKYYITETRHLYHEKVYNTDFSVRGLRDGSLLSTVAPQVHLQPGQTLMVGLVTNNKDPEGWGRVKVKLPTLTEEHESNWARVVSVGAGSRRGFDCLPEVGDEVLVGFEHGDIHRPYVFGGVWNGKDKPPEPVDNDIQGGKVRLRTIKTRTGHTIQFVEEDKGSSKAGVYIETTKGHKIALNDSDRHVEITTNGGHRIKMDDAGQSITVSSTLNLTLEAKGNININANGTITVKGAMIYLN